MFLALTVTIGGTAISLEAIGAAITAVGGGIIAVGKIIEKEKAKKNEK